MHNKILAVASVLLVMMMSGAAATQKGASVTSRAAGTFDVKVTPQTDEFAANAGLGRMTLDKQFHGDLEAVSKGEMLASGTGAAGTSGAYVALEKVTGKLNGRAGTFVLMHNGVMTRGSAQLTVTVVPDSGTSELAGLSGKMTIIIAEGKHSYEFEYTLPGSATP